MENIEKPTTAFIVLCNDEEVIVRAVSEITMATRYDDKGYIEYDRRGPTADMEYGPFSDLEEALIKAYSHISVELKNLQKDNKELIKKYNKELEKINDLRDRLNEAREVSENPTYVDKREFRRDLLRRLAGQFEDEAGVLEKEY